MAVKNNITVNFTRGIVEAFACPPEKSEAFLWDNKTPGLGLRAYSTGSVIYLFQARLNSRTVRVRIGSRDAWDIDKARTEARRLQLLIDTGIDPRTDRADKDQAREDVRLSGLRASVTVGEVWQKYITANCDGWGELHRRDHDLAVQVPGLPRKRSKLLTTEGTLYSLLGLRLDGLTTAVVQHWIESQTKVRPTKAALGFRLFRAFLNWCEDQPEYRGLADPGLLLTRAVRKKVAPSKAKKDSLQREMLKVWFTEIHRNPDPVVTAYFETILLTGNRPGALIRLRWTDVDFQWRKMVVRNKAEGNRDIPLTPYLAQKLASLPRRNAWVFSSLTSKSGRLEDVGDAHDRAVASGGLPHLTLHGLRRSFGTVAEWVECPDGIVKQIQGHAPGGIAEKHYRVRPLDLLRMWHTKIEGWILEQADIEQPKAEQATGLRVVV